MTLRFPAKWGQIVTNVGDLCYDISDPDEQPKSDMHPNSMIAIHVFSHRSSAQSDDIFRSRSLMDLILSKWFVSSDRNRSLSPSEWHAAFLCIRYL